MSEARKSYEAEQARKKQLEAQAKREAERIKQDTGVKNVSAAIEMKHYTAENSGKGTQAKLEEQRTSAEQPKVTKKPAPKTRTALRKPEHSFPEVIQDLYDKSNYTPTSKLNEIAKTKGPAAAREAARPKTLGEAFTRLAYASAEVVGGGIREATLGLTGSMGVENRPGGIMFQLAGGLLTPSVADYAAGFALTKLSKTTAGQKILASAYHNKLKLLNKVDDLGITEGNMAILFRKSADLDPWSIDDYRYMNNVIGRIKAAPNLSDEMTDFVINDARVFESITGVGKASTTERRQAKRVISNLYKQMLKEADVSDVLDANKIVFSAEEIAGMPKSTLEDLMGDSLKYYDKNTGKARMYVINETPDTELLYGVIDDLGYETDTYINMLKSSSPADAKLGASLLLLLPKKERDKIFEELDKAELNRTAQYIFEDEAYLNYLKDEEEELSSTILGDKQTTEQTTNQEEEQTTTQEEEQITEQETEEETIIEEETIQETTITDIPEDSPPPEEEPIIPEIPLPDIDFTKPAKRHSVPSYASNVRFSVRIIYYADSEQLTVEAKSAPQAVSKAITRRRLRDKDIIEIHVKRL